MILPISWRSRRCASRSCSTVWTSEAETDSAVFMAGCSFGWSDTFAHRTDDWPGEELTAGRVRGEDRDGPNKAGGSRREDDAGPRITLPPPRRACKQLLRAFVRASHLSS